MINRTHLSLSVLFVIGLAGAAFGQHSKLSGYVYDGNNTPRPNITVVIAGAGTAVTDSDGHFSAILPDAQFKPGQPLTIRVNNWKVFDPIFGQCQTQDISFKEIRFRVTIVPPRSVAAHLNRERLGAIVEAYEKSVSNLTGGVADLYKVLARKDDVVAALTDEMGDFKQESEKYTFLKKYSEEYEISVDEIKTALDDWAHSKQAVDEQEKARKAYWNGDSAQVLKLTDDIDEDARFARQERQRGLKVNGSRIEKFRLRGNTFMIGKRYMEALAVFRQLEQLFEERIFSSEDFPQDWIHVNAAISLMAIQAQLTASDEVRKQNSFIDESSKALRRVENLNSIERAPAEWAVMRLASVTIPSITESTAPENVKLTHLDDIIAACNEVQVATRGGEKLFTPEKMPEVWIMSEMLRGTAFRDTGMQIKGADGIPHLNSAIAAFKSIRNADTAGVRAYFRKRSPESWVSVNYTLAILLSELAGRTAGPEGVADLKESIATFESILSESEAGVKICSPTTLPREWAATQDALAVTLINLGRRLEGPEGVTQLKNAVTVYKAVLEAHNGGVKIYTPENFPNEWRNAQSSLGFALIGVSSRVEGSDSLTYLRDGIAAFRTVFEASDAGKIGFTPEKFPQEWVMAQRLRGAALYTLGHRTEGPEGVKHLRDAVVIYNSILSASGAAGRIYTPEKFTQDWVQTQLTLAQMLGEYSQRVTGPESLTSINDSISAARAILEASSGGVKIYAPERAPQEWVSAQLSLANGYYALNKWEEARNTYADILRLFPDAQAAYKGLGSIYHEETFEFDKAFALQEQWLARHQDDLDAQIEFAEVHFTIGRFSQCNQRIDSLLAMPGVQVNTKAALRVIEIASLLALGSDKQVLGKLEALIAGVELQPAAFKVKGSWRLDGTKYFIAHHEKLKPYGAWLNLLFDAFESTDHDSFVKALREAQAKLKSGELSRAQTSTQPRFKI
jgi:tetratricopeptide (TPR) repeat protein